MRRKFDPKKALKHQEDDVPFLWWYGRRGARKFVKKMLSRARRRLNKNPRLWDLPPAEPKNASWEII